MLTLPQAIARLRADLGDTDPMNQTWSEEALVRHIERALQELSQAQPREMKTSLTTTPGSRDLSVAGLAGRLRISAVEYPPGEYPPAYVRWSLWQDTLTLLVSGAPAGAQAVNVYWEAAHLLDPAGSTLPEGLEDILLTGAAGYAAREAATRLTNQVNQGGAAVPSRYANLADANLKAFQAALRSRRPLRTAALYNPAGQLPSQTADWGPA